ncbi:hypothetical protein ACKRZS_009999 [Fusarium odoratissimum]
MRAWLMHWYQVADNLFTKFNVFATAPNPDWFMRPRMRPRSRPRPAPVESTAKHPPSPISNLVLDSEADDIDRLVAPVSSSIFDWSSRSSEATEINTDGQAAIFDPTPGGRVFTSQGRLGSASTSGVLRPWFRYNHTVEGSLPPGVTDTTSPWHNPITGQFVPLEDFYEEDLFESASDSSCSVCESLFDYEVENVSSQAHSDPLKLA